MATYQYRCPGCGSFEVTRPIGQARREEACTACGHGSRRVFTAPMLTRTSGAVAGAQRTQEASAHEPRVVSEVPSARRVPARSADPRQALLPKP
jgi:putative FmdB family regulatory protein